MERFFHGLTAKANGVFAKPLYRISFISLSIIPVLLVLCSGGNIFYKAYALKTTEKLIKSEYAGNLSVSGVYYENGIYTVCVIDFEGYESTMTYCPNTDEFTDNYGAEALLVANMRKRASIIRKFNSESIPFDEIKADGNRLIVKVPLISEKSEFFEVASDISNAALDMAVDYCVIAAPFTDGTCFLCRIEAGADKYEILRQTKLTVIPVLY